MKRAIGTATAFALTSLCLCASADAKIVTFQIPDGLFVRPVGINDKGEVAGWYEDSHGAIHGFLFQPVGGLLTFDVPGSQGTVPVAISPDGVITGSYQGGASGGFLRAADGSFTTFTVGPDTSPRGANKKGWIVGEYDRYPPYQSFLRDPSGATMEFYLPRARNGVAGMVLNRSRTIAGSALVQTSPPRWQGFVRPAHGAAVLFGDSHFEVEVAAINDAGTVAGSFKDQNTVAVAFFRTNDGTITTFVGPNGATSAQAHAISNSGTIVGEFVDGSGHEHGLLRAADGRFTPFDVGGALYTEIRAINDKGAIAGIYATNGGTFLFAGKP